MTVRELERRHVALPVELRAAGDGGLGTLSGYAAKFNVYSQNLGGFVERIAPGAFDKSLADEVRVICRYNHDDAALLGTTEAGTLTLDVDDVGLAYENPLPDTSAGRDVSVLAGRGDLRYSSFAFYCIDDDWGFTEQGFPLRTVLQAQLVDVAPVNSPAYLDSTAAVRSLAKARGVDAPPDFTPEAVLALMNTSTDAPDERAQDAPAAPTPPTDDVSEGQRATHPAVTIEALRLELDALQ